MNNLLSLYWKKILLVLLFFTITPATIFAGGLSLLSLTENGRKEIKLLEEDLYPNAHIYAAARKNSDFPGVSAQIVAEDAREEIIENYLNSQNSPLTSFSSKIVEVSDKYGLDYRLLPAIAQKESGLCRVIPEGSHNCWGWGIHSKGTLKFDNYDIALETVAKGLRENYIDKGYVTPEQIMKKYAHPDSTTWAEGVNLYMDQME